MREWLGCRGWARRVRAAVGLSGRICVVGATVALSLPFPGFGDGARVVAGFIAGYHLRDVLRRVEASPFIRVTLELEALVDLTVGASLPVVSVECGGTSD